MKSYEELKEQYLNDGWLVNWGDGAINQPNICILMKETQVPLRDWEIPPSGSKVKFSRDYVVLSSFHSPVIFTDVSSYSC